MAEVEPSLRDRAVIAAATLVCFGMLTGMIRLTPWAATDWRTAGLVVSVVTFAAYGLHRYERVSLGLVQEDES